MKFLNYTFEQSQSLVTKDIVEKAQSKRELETIYRLVYHFNCYLFLLYYHTHVYKRIDA